MITIYGIPASRACRPLWMLEELDLDYQNVPTHFVTGETRAPEYLKLNPNGHIPTMVDGDLVLWESMAINLYLARTYGQGTLWPASEADQARAVQWCVWLMTEVEDLLVTAMVHRAFLPEDKRDLALADKNEKRLAKPFGVLDAHLDGKGFVVGDRVSVADISAAAVISWTSLAKIDLTPYPNLQRWLEACTARPAAQRVFAMMNG